MGLDEGPVLAGELGEGMQSLAGASSAGPSRSGSRRQGHHGHFTGSQGCFTGSADLGRHRDQRRVPTEHIVCFDVFDLAVGTEAILGESDATLPQV